MELDLLIPAFWAFVVSVVLVALLSRPTRRLGLVDHPGGRKRHGRAVPLAGGLGMFAAFWLVAVAFADRIPDTGLLALLAGTALMCLVGVLDDLRDLPASLKGMAQLAAAAILVWGGGLTVTALGNAGDSVDAALGLMAVPFTLLCTVGLINAVNMMDGQDGLAGSVVLVSLVALVLVTVIAGMPGAGMVPAMLAGVVLGFLVLNFPYRARRTAHVFMGDGGSLMLGFALAWVAIEIPFGYDLDVPAVTIAWILALPAWDTVCLLVRRAVRGRNPLSPDREHLHHVMMRAGFSRLQAIWLLIAVSTVFAAIGIAGWIAGVPQSLMYAGLVLMLSLHLYFTEHGWRLVRGRLRARTL